MEQYREEQEPQEPHGRMREPERAESREQREQPEVSELQREQPEPQVQPESQREPERQQAKPQVQQPSRVSRAAALTFCMLVFALALMPFVGMPLAPAQTTSEDAKYAVLPTLVDEDGAVSLSYLKRLGEWFEHNFAWRNEFIAVDARIRADVFGTSTNDEVIVGTDGWLYYGGTISDYVGASPLTERELRCIAHNLSFMQEYTKAQGAQFAFTVAPNKNSLYPEHMPARYIAATEPSNAERLAPYLEEYKVTTVDLFALPGDAKADAEADVGANAEGSGSSTSRGSSGSSASPDASGSLYLKGDTHWDNRGALIADTALAKALGITPLPSGAWVERTDAVGDLDWMLFPGLPTPERQFYREGINDGPGLTGSSWSYDLEATDAALAAAAGAEEAEVASVEADDTKTNDAEAAGGDADDADGAAAKVDDVREKGVEANLIWTRGKGLGTLVMYRDSFGNALLPYLATQTKDAEFSKLLPYNALHIVDRGADFVLVERAERHLDYLARNAPIMPCPTAPLDTAKAKRNTAAEARSTCEQSVTDVLVNFGGVIDPRLIEDDSLVYVSIEQASGDRAASGSSASSAGGGTTTAATGVIGERVYEAFLLSPEGQATGNGYLVSIPQTVFSKGEWSIKVFVTQGDELFLVQSTRYRVAGE
jgi:hypothetical protein